MPSHLSSTDSNGFYINYLIATTDPAPLFQIRVGVYILDSPLFLSISLLSLFETIWLLYLIFLRCLIFFAISLVCIAVMLMFPYWRCILCVCPAKMFSLRTKWEGCLFLASLPPSPGPVTNDRLQGWFCRAGGNRLQRVAPRRGGVTYVRNCVPHAQGVIGAARWGGGAQPTLRGPIGGIRSGHTPIQLIPPQTSRSGGL